MTSQAEPKRLIPRKVLEYKSGLKGGSLVRAIARGILPESVVIGPGTIRWWEHEVDEALARLKRGKGEKRVKRESETEARLDQLPETAASAEAPDPPPKRGPGWPRKDRQVTANMEAVRERPPPRARTPAE